MSRFRGIWSGILIRKTQTNSEGSRGTGPRATGTGRFLGSRTAVFIVGRGPVPRHAPVYRTIAGDRPPRYGNGTFSSQ